MFIQFSKLYAIMFGYIEILVFAVLEWLLASDAMCSWNSIRSINWCLQPFCERTWLLLMFSLLFSTLFSQFISVRGLIRKTLCVFSVYFSFVLFCMIFVCGWCSFFQTECVNDFFSLGLFLRHFEIGFCFRYFPTLEGIDPYSKSFVSENDIGNCKSICFHALCVLLYWIMEYCKSIAENVKLSMLNFRDICWFLLWYICYQSCIREWK